MERTLSQNEAKIVLDLEWRNQKTVRLIDLREALGASEGYARYLSHRLVKKGWLVRLRPGLFQFVPASRGREGVADYNPLAAGDALVSPYFFSFGTACTRHGLTEQVFAEVYLACRERRRSEIILEKRYCFAHVPKHRFFGFEEVRVLGHAVRMATVERALLDAVDRPRYAGGMGEISRIAARAAHKVSWRKLIGLLRRWDSSALVQRLGYFMDVTQSHLPEDARADLVGLVRPRSNIQLGPRRRWGTGGRLVRPWSQQGSMENSRSAPSPPATVERLVRAVFQRRRPPGQAEFRADGMNGLKLPCGCGRIVSGQIGAGRNRE